MSDRDRTIEEDAEEQQDADVDGAIDDDVVLDVDAMADDDVAALQERVEEQDERIEELENLLLDLSARVADGRDMGVCPDCHGPVMKVSRWIRPDTIECKRCGRQFHKY